MEGIRTDGFDEGGSRQPSPHPDGDREQVVLTKADLDNHLPILMATANSWTQLKHHGINRILVSAEYMPMFMKMIEKKRLVGRRGHQEGKHKSVLDDVRMI